MSGRLLLLLLADVSGDELEQAVAAAREPAESVFVVAPHEIGVLDWLATDERRARGAAEARVLEAEWLLDGVVELSGEAGEADPVLAVSDALKHFAADEIVVVGRGTLDAALLRSLRSLGVPLRLSGLRPARSGLRGRVRDALRGLQSGRSLGTPWAAMIAANLGLVLLAVVGSALVALAVWLIGRL